MEEKTYSKKPKELFTSSLIFCMIRDRAFREDLFYELWPIAPEKMGVSFFFLLFLCLCFLWLFFLLTTLLTCLSKQVYIVYIKNV